MRRWVHDGGDHRHHAALVDARDRIDGDVVRERVHQRCGVPDSHPAHRTRTRPGEGGPAVVDAELRHGDHPHRVGLCRRPDRRARRAGRWLGADRGRGVRGGIGALVGRSRRISASRWNGGGKQQHRQWPAGGWLVPTATARPRDGYPADGPAAGSRAGRLGDSPACGELRRCGRAAVSRRGVRGRRRGMRSGREGSTPPSRAPRPPSTSSPTPIGARRRCGASMRCRCFWSRRR